MPMEKVGKNPHSIFLVSEMKSILVNLYFRKRNKLNVPLRFSKISCLESCQHSDFLQNSGKQNWSLYNENMTSVSFIQCVSCLF